MTKGDLSKTGRNVRRNSANSSSLVHRSNRTESSDESDSLDDEIDLFDENERTGETGSSNKIVGLIVFTLVIVGFIYGGIQVKQWLEDEQQLPVQKVIFSGERRILVDAEMEALIRQNQKTALAGFNAMQSLLSSTGLTINALFLSERFAWRVELSNGIRLNIGRQQFIDRLQNFIDIFPLLQAQNKAINYIDLRYDIGLAVGWQKNDKKEQEITENND